MIGFKIKYIDEKFNVKQLCTLEWSIKKFRGFEANCLSLENLPENQFYLNSFACKGGPVEVWHYKKKLTIQQI